MTIFSNKNLFKLYTMIWAFLYLNLFSLFIFALGLASFLTLYFRNFVGQFLLFIFPFLLSTVVALIVFNLLNQFISGYFLVTLPYLALHGFLTGMLFLLILLLISSLVFLALINSDKKIQRTLKAAFH